MEELFDMKIGLAAAAFLLTASFTVINAQTSEIPNPAIDMKGYLKIAEQAAEHRSNRRLTEEDFLKMSKEDSVIILDARSKQKYDELHINGAVNLSFPDITVESLEQMFPDKNVKILIYCNNNFLNAEDAFPRKKATASLNISTYISLYTYGYRNVYELGPLLDVKKTKLDLVSSGKDVDADVATLRMGSQRSVVR